MNEETVPVRVWCKGCGEEFVAFLQKMAERNAEVVYPKCGEVHTRKESVDPANN